MSQNKPVDPDAIQKLLGELRSKIPMMIELECFKAKLVRERYRALVSAGFTEAQALEIVKAWPAI